MLVQYLLILFIFLFQKTQAQTESGSCVNGLNFTKGSGCCDSSNRCCNVGVDRCCCDQQCYSQQDCCLDIWLLDCLPTEGQPTISPSYYSCSGLYGVSDGCCTGDSCRSTEQYCYCDDECYYRDDCCVDILDIGCKCNLTCSAHFGTFITTECCTGEDCGPSCCKCDQECYDRGDCCSDIEAWGCYSKDVAENYCKGEKTTADNDTQIYLWKTTPPGTTVHYNCPSKYDGNVTRVCSAQGEWDPPNFDDCQDATLLDLLNQIRFDLTLPPEERAEVVSNVTDALDALTADPSTHMFPNNVRLITNIMSESVDVLIGTIGEIDSSKAYLELKHLNVFNNLLDGRYQNSFTRIGNSSGGINEVMRVYESYSNYAAMFKVEYSDTAEEEDIIEQDNLVLKINVNNNARKTDVSFPSKNDLVGFDVDSYPSVSYLGNDLNEFSTSGRLTTVNSLVRNIGDFLNEQVSQSSSTQLGSVIISTLVVSDTQSARLPGLLNITTKRFSNKTLDNIRCGYWDPDENNGDGGWSTDGIELIDNVTFTNGTTTWGQITCKIYHQTPFSVLVDVQGVEYNPVEQYALEVVGYIGISVSIVCLVITIVCLMLLGKQMVLSTQYFIHFNLSLALLAGYVTFFLFIDDKIVDVTHSKAGCAVVAAFLQFFFTAAFSWMMCEGIMLFLLLVIVFTSISKRWYVFLIIGWGVPLIPVVISAGVIHDHYGSPGRHCWIEVQNSSGAIWAFVGPMMIILSVNIFFLIMAVRALIIHHRNKLKTETKRVEYALFKKTLIGTITLLPLMGVTWLIGVFAVDENTTVFAWLFVVMNSLQGLFIFIFNIVRNDRIKDNVMQKLCPKMARAKKNQSRTSTSGVSRAGTYRSGVKRSDSFAFNANKRPLSSKFLTAFPTDDPSKPMDDDKENIYDNIDEDHVEDNIDDDDESTTDDEDQREDA